MNKSKIVIIVLAALLVIESVCFGGYIYMKQTNTEPEMIFGVNYIPRLPASDSFYATGSLVPILANPKRYHKKRVRFCGICSIQKDKIVMYCMSDDYENNITPNAVLVEAPVGELSDKVDNVIPSDADGKYIYLDGNFDAKSKGDNREYAGTLRKIGGVSESFMNQIGNAQ